MTVTALEGGSLGVDGLATSSRRLFATKMIDTRLWPWNTQVSLSGVSREQQFSDFES
jgi:hypothetical protein